MKKYIKPICTLVSVQHEGMLALSATNQMGNGQQYVREDQGLGTDIWSN